MFAPQRWLTLRNAMMITGAVTALAQAQCQNEAASALRNLPATYPAQGYASYGPYVGEGTIPIGYPAAANEVWAWPERTYALDRVFYDTPPDYAFDYGGYRPFVWETANDWTMYADPFGDGRYYYYEPNSQRPYFIRDNQYGYGFDDTGRLIGIFNLLGQLMPNSFLGTQAPVAADYYARAYDMRRLGLRAPPLTVADTLWLQRQPVIVGDFNRWLRAAQADPWVEYRVRTNGLLVRAFDGEVKRRKAHPGFPEHAKGWGPPFLRDGDRRIVIASVTDPGVVVVEGERGRDRSVFRRDDRAFEGRDRGRDDRGRDDRGHDRAGRSDDDGPRFDDRVARGEDRGRDRADRGKEDRGPDRARGGDSRGKGGDQRADRGRSNDGGGNGKGKSG